MSGGGSGFGFPVMLQPNTAGPDSHPVPLVAILDVANDLGRNHDLDACM